MVKGLWFLHVRATAYNRLLLYIRHGVILVVLVATLFPTGIAATATPATVQNFDTPNTGTDYALGQWGNPLPAQVVSGGPTRVGKFLRLAPAASDILNTITFPNTVPPANWIVADFDFRITPGSSINPDTGRADGFSFALLSNDATGAQSEEPNFPGSFGVGFDIYKNPGDIGNVNIRGSFSNSLSIHFDEQVVKQVDASRVVDLAGGGWIHARIILRPGGGFSDVTVILIPQNCEPVTLVKNLPIPGLAPYEAHLQFGARTGGETANHDIDNIRVQFLKLTQSVLSLSAFSYNVGEANTSAVVTVTRTGNTQSTAQIDYSTSDSTAKAGTDYSTASGILTFGPGEIKKNITIPILRTPGSAREADEIFQVTLKNARGAFPGGPAKAAVKIFDFESAQAVGRWNPLMCWPIVATHMHLLPTLKVLFWDRLGNISFWDPANQQVTKPIRLEHNLFCSGHAFLPEGKLLVTGGHDHHEGGPSGDGAGLKQASAYNPVTNEWTMLPDMNNGRWYPTTTALASGEMLVISGTYRTSDPNPVITLNLVPQVWQPTTGTWRDLTGAAGQPVNSQAHGVDLYPRMFLAPDGRVFKAGPDKDTWFLNTAGTGKWVPGPDSNFGFRNYGSAVMYEPGKILIVGGGDPNDQPDMVPDATDTAEVIDLNATAPAWQTVSSMQFARRHLNATLLADGTVLVTGGTGASGSNNEADPVLRAELWNPVSKTWTTLPAMQVTRGYHSTALLLPDGRVLVAGGGQGSNATGNHNNAEIYSPAYLFKGARPKINAAPAAITYGQSFTVSTPDAANITKVSLVRFSSVTHAFDENQRFTWLNFSVTGNGLSVTAPANGKIAPPGHYMLFILNSNGVPSVAKIIKIS